MEGFLQTKLTLCMILLFGICSSFAWAEQDQTATQPLEANQAQFDTSFSTSSAVENLSQVKADLNVPTMRASGENLGTAIGHFGRARSLLIEAVREFDRGRRLARPDALIDSEKWRQTLIVRTEELDKVLTPQPRATRGGVRFNADTRLLNLQNK